MSNIGRVDQAVLQLRAQLQRLARERRQGANATGRSEARPLERLREVHAGRALGDGEFRRKFVRALLTEELGEPLANQPEFERISNEVCRLIDQDADTRALMDQALRQLGVSSV